jgi:hypothetical protein
MADFDWLAPGIQQQRHRVACPGVVELAVGVVQNPVRAVTK